MSPVKALIHSNVYIALAAVMLTVESQIQLGMAPQWHPYLFIIFFSTLFEYNLHRLITVLTHKEALHSDKHRWVKENLKTFYVFVVFSTIGFLCAVHAAKREVLIALAPIGLLTLFYSMPHFHPRAPRVRLRYIPYAKIFFIAVVWSTTTTLLPVVQSGASFDPSLVLVVLAQRFCFIFAITIPFDIRDAEVDRSAGLKTIPLLLGERGAWTLACVVLVFFVGLVWWQYRSFTDPVAFALAVSAASTMAALFIKRLRELPFYHYGILDGTMLLQGALVYLSAFVKA